MSIKATLLTVAAVSAAGCIETAGTQPEPPVSLCGFTLYRDNEVRDCFVYFPWSASPQGYEAHITTYPPYAKVGPVFWPQSYDNPGVVAFIKDTNTCIWTECL